MPTDDSVEKQTEALFRLIEERLDESAAKTRKMINETLDRRLTKLSENVEVLSTNFKKLSEKIDDLEYGQKRAKRQMEELQADFEFDRRSHAVMRGGAVEAPRQPMITTVQDSALHSEVSNRSVMRARGRLS
tara:strand:- start:2106 stop:2501 length:396 start_codon:yes stop_codon:yes gene_type:complete